MDRDWNQLAKVELNVADYDNLVSLAKANEEEINRRAVELYRKNGVCEIRLDVSIERKLAWPTDDRFEKFQYTLSPRVYNEESEYNPSPFCINRQMVKRIKKVAKDIAENSFYYNFGGEFMQLNNIAKYRKHTETIRFRFLVVTITGWALAVIITLIAIFI